MSEYPQFTHQPQQLEAQQLQIQQQKPMNMDYNAYPMYDQTAYKPGNNYEPDKPEYQYAPAKAEYYPVDNTQSNIPLDQSAIAYPKFAEAVVPDQKSSFGVRRISTFNQRYISHDHWALNENSQDCFGKMRKLVFKYHYLCFPGYCIVSIAFMITILVLAILNKMDIEGFSGTLYTIVNNLNGKPISDIAVIPGGSACPNGYSLMSLGNWPGTYQSCYCDNGNAGSPSFTPNFCTSKQQGRGCVTIDSISGQNYYVWRGSSFCAKYINNSLSQTTCPLGYTICHLGGCYPSNGGCPITNTTFFPNTLPPLLINIKDGQSQPIIGFQISMNGLPCLDHSRAPSYNDYPPLNALRPIGCPSIDPGALYSLDQYDQASLLTNNNMNGIMGISGYQSTIQGSQANLVAIQKYQVANSSFCLSLTPDCFSYVQNTLSDYLNTYIGFSIGAIVCLFCLGLGYLFGQLLRNNDSLFKNKPNCSIILQFVFVMVFNLCSLISILILEIILIAVHIQDKNSISSCLDQINQIVNNQCFIQAINNSLTYYTNLWQDKTQTIIGLTSAAIAISAVFFPFYIIYFVFYFRKKN